MNKDAMNKKRTEKQREGSPPGDRIVGVSEEGKGLSNQGVISSGSDQAQGVKRQSQERLQQ